MKISKLVLLPGLDGTGVLLTELHQRLSRQIPTKIISYPIYDPLTYDQLIDHVRQQVPDAPYVILGESFSGPIAIDLAANDKNVAGMILSSSFARNPLSPFISRLVHWYFIKLIPYFLVRRSLLGPYGTPELYRTHKRILSEIPNRVLQLRAKQSVHIDKTEALDRTTCPALYLRGTSDRLVKEKAFRYIRGRLRQIELKTFNAPHMLLQTHPAEASEAILEFCNRCLSKTPAEQHH